MIDLGFHHLGVAVRDLAVGASHFQKLFGFKVLRGPIEDPLQGVRAVFLGPEDVPSGPLYELVAPLVPGARSPLDRVLDKGNTSYHVCYQVSSIEAAIEHFTEGDALLVSEPTPAVAFDGRRIAWVLLPTRHLVELLERQNWK